MEKNLIWAGPLLQRRPALHTIPAVYYIRHITEQLPAYIGGLLQTVLPHDFRKLFPDVF